MLTISGLSLGYGSQRVIDDLDWSCGDADALVTALLGPSGCGKSTLIRAIAGLEPVRAGRILFDGNDLGPVPAHRRDFGVVFQDGALFAGRTVAANIAYGLRVRRWSRSAIAERVRQMLELVRLPDVGSRRVEELSGGQAQRVALARALAPRPRLLLLDEPLAALDRRLRDALAGEIADIVRTARTPTIVVTHDHGEAAQMADAIAVMRAGAIVQTARPADLWASPADEWTARFLGCTTVIEARRSGPESVTTALGDVALRLAASSAMVGLRAESVVAEPDRLATADGATQGATGTVGALVAYPGGPRVRVQTAVGEIDALATTMTAVGDRVRLRLVPERLAVIGEPR